MSLELTGGALVARVLAQAIASDEVWCINVMLDPAASRRTGRVSMAV